MDKNENEGVDMAFVLNVKRKCVWTQMEMSRVWKQNVENTFIISFSKITCFILTIFNEFSILKSMSRNEIAIITIFQEFEVKRKFFLSSIIKFKSMIIWINNVI